MREQIEKAVQDLMNDPTLSDLLPLQQHSEHSMSKQRIL